MYTMTLFQNKLTNNLFFKRHQYFYIQLSIHVVLGHFFQKCILYYLQKEVFYYTENRKYGKYL